ncbi:hypothetical protein LAZ67_X003160 [Cordylochernes scorpioides]|uniref:Mariner Mos1 transposase n=1 Tax=Cordylochernes scorpioides TaxID=51811 RepID=A0ABY6LWG6_9ARAC|nr:hypothetical protein LAZ67_X003160 [Cordylochernes scorpioides]
MTTNEIRLSNEMASQNITPCCGPVGCSQLRLGSSCYPVRLQTRLQWSSGHSEKRNSTQQASLEGGNLIETQAQQAVLISCTVLSSTAAKDGPRNRTDRLTSGFHRRAKAKTSLEDDDVPIDDTTTKPLFTPQENGRKGTRDKVPRLRWNPWQKHVKSTSQSHAHQLQHTEGKQEQKRRQKFIEPSRIFQEAHRRRRSNTKQKELAKTLGFTQPTIFNRLKQLGMIRKVGNWSPYEPKPRDIEHCSFTCEQLLQSKKRKGRSISIIQNVRQRVDTLAVPHNRWPSHGGKIMPCIWWDQLGVVYYELLQLNKRITGEHCEKNGCNTPIDTTIILPHLLYSPDIAPSDYYLFRSLQHGLADQHFSKYNEVKKWIDKWIAAKEPAFFRDKIC